ncbi:MAG TPA: phosphopentomutase, partial [Chthoniobacterales bacterium]
MRALLLVLDSVGIGGAPDAARYGDEGANTLGHILEQLPDLALPNLESLGLAELAPGYRSYRSHTTYKASYGKMEERSAGKDTTTGHWELAGVILDEPFATFHRFPDDLVNAIERDAGVEFIGNYPQSGTTILSELGVEHIQTGKPILYTSADSVLQIAAHENVIAPERLYDICRIAREHADPFRIGRVIARPFTGPAESFARTSRRHDFSMVPPPTILNAISEHGQAVIGIGKISDIFAGQGITESIPTADNGEGMERIAEKWEALEEGLVFANLVDFDMLCGHRRDVAGYARLLAEFDEWLGEFIPKIQPQDLVVITGDHGNDPTHPGTDHTREQVPLFVLHNNEVRDLGVRKTFADVAATLGNYFEVAPAWPVGESVLSTNVFGGFDRQT